MKMEKIAIVQEAPVLLDLEKGVKKAAKLIREAGKEGADLVVFPECWLTGYPAWVFEMAGWDCSNARHWYAKFLAQCPTAEDDALLPIRKAAIDAGVHIVMGFNEKPRTSSGSIFNSTMTIGPKGDTLNIHRKLILTLTERNIWAQGDASGLKVIESDIGRIGSLICWEHWHPLARHTLHHQDEQIHIACWPDMADSHAIASRHYAFEGRCFVVAAAQYLTTDDVPDELVEAYRAGTGAPNEISNVLFNGGSGVIGPDGNWVTEQVFGESKIIYTDIDLTDTVKFKQDLDIVGHYSRDDIFQLSVNCTTPQGLIVKNDVDVNNTKNPAE
ncbi:carbon-nitrogen hydrolase family protein [Marinomonas colpomeniae]|nr:carbon-nitrogen hydrolase family protein [Marinomonas colpomeniae]